MHIVLSALGSAGDVLPFLALARALRARGHALCLLAPQPFEAQARHEGIDFRALGRTADFDAITAQPDLWHPRRGLELVLGLLGAGLREAYRTTVEAVQPGRTVLVGSSLSWNVRLAQERLRLPALTVHLSPACIASAHAPPRLAGLPSLAGWPVPLVRAWLAIGERVWLDPLAARGLDPLRAELGLPRVRRILSRWVHSPDGVACAWPDWFSPLPADGPPRSRTTGFPLWPEATQPLVPELERFLAQGTAPVGLTTGSAMRHGRDVFERGLAACEALGHRALLISSSHEQVPSPLPPFARHVEFAPFGALLPRLGALVHHGGIGTSARALAAGLPQLLVPFAHDQFDNAARLHALGVARVLPRNAAPATWARALREIGPDTAAVAAARRAAQRLADDGDGIARMVHLVEALEPKRN